MTSAMILDKNFIAHAHDKEKRRSGRENKGEKRGRTFVRSVDARKPGNSFVEYTRNGPP